MSTSSAPAAASTTPTDRRRSPEFKYVPQGSSVGYAWALELDEDCLDRWGNTLYDRLRPGTRATMSPDEVHDVIHQADWKLLTAEHIVYQSYCKFPNLPRLEHSVLVIRRSTGWKWLFVLKDNSSREALNAPVTPEDVEGLKVFLGIKHQEAKWFNVLGYLNDIHVQNFPVVHQIYEIHPSFEPS
ncbi:hypothetical protein C8Q80DRAFT_1124259 [Daedaleopsis nitida]|nr:hypothetical protein C8Q80DRAFT_1124259 [Daedaleopsis nitida]